jgi:hypothetical protein
MGGTQARLPPPGGHLNGAGAAGISVSKFCEEFGIREMKGRNYEWKTKF